jgi:lysozyme
VYDTRIKLLSLHEGRVAHVYKDSLGYWTIGVGHLVDPRKGGKLPEHIIDALLEWDIAEHWHELVERAPWVRGLDDVRQAVLLDMAFNLGVTGLLGFHTTLKLVRLRRFVSASVQMLDSKWAGQVKGRAIRLSKMMETGQWPES